MTPRAREAAIRWGGCVASLAYAGVIAWLLASQPATMSEVSGGLAASVGLYRVDQARFDDGLRYFRGDRFPEARAAFAHADPASRDAVTQFYVAYAFYRQGWGRFSNDDALFQQAMSALDRAAAAAPGGRVIVDDPNLGLHTADELRAELEHGLTPEWSDLNPMRVFRARQ